MNNKKGWIKIVEAFVAIILIASVLLIILNKSDFQQTDDKKIYEIELSILREIQTNTTMRDAIMNANAPIELYDDGFPLIVKNQLISRIPNQLECNAKICAGGDDCNLRNAPQKDIYSQKILITATLTQYNPTQLKMFCWSK